MKALNLNLKQNEAQTPAQNQQTRELILYVVFTRMPGESCRRPL